MHTHFTMFVTCNALHTAAKHLHEGMIFFGIKYYLLCVLPSKLDPLFLTVVAKIISCSLASRESLLDLTSPVEDIYVNTCNTKSNSNARPLYIFNKIECLMTMQWSS